MVTERLHPCPTCRHGTMDECWATEKKLRPRGRRICLDCHDDCLAKVDDNGTIPSRRPAERESPPDLRELLLAGPEGR